MPRLMLDAVAGILCATGCASLGPTLGFRAPPVEDASLVVTNGLDQAVNVYAFPRSGVGEVFVGRIPARSTDTVRVRGLRSGARAWLRATPIGGGASFRRNATARVEGVSWRIP